MSATTAPAPAPRKANPMPFTTLHYLREADMLRAQVFGVPARALCGDEFVPRSGDAENGTAAGPNAVICPDCQSIYDDLSSER